LPKFSLAKEKEMKLYFSNPYTVKLGKKITRTLLVAVFIFTSFQSVIGQSGADYTKAQAVINKIFNKQIPNTYLLFSQDNSYYLVVEKKESGYEEHFLRVDERNNVRRLNSRFVDINTTLDRAFNKEVYHKDYINLDSEFFISSTSFSGGDSVYFYHKNEDGNIYGEANLSTVIHPNPIDVSVFGYLLNELQEYI
jgi:hypothetical protein